MFNPWDSEKLIIKFSINSRMVQMSGHAGYHLRAASVDIWGMFSK
jgi:hypothetical protein